MNYNNNVQKKCGFCGESIPYEARRCPYCGSILEIPVDNNYGMNAPADDSSAQGQTWQDQAKQPETLQNVQQDAEIGMGADAGQNPQAVPGSGQQQDEGAESGAESGAQANSAPDSSASDHAYKPSADADNRMSGYPAGTGSPAGYGNDMRTPLSNGLKVFLTAVSTVIPGIGQLVGIIAAIVFMNSEGDRDRKSFGAALLVASLSMFVLACIGCFVILIVYSSAIKQLGQFNY